MKSDIIIIGAGIVDLVIVLKLNEKFPNEKVATLKAG